MFKLFMAFILLCCSYGIADTGYVENPSEAFKLVVHNDGFESTLTVGLESFCEIESGFYEYESGAQSILIGSLNGESSPVASDRMLNPQKPVSMPMVTEIAIVTYIHVVLDLRDGYVPLSQYEFSVQMIDLNGDESLYARTILCPSPVCVPLGSYVMDGSSCNEVWDSMSTLGASNIGPDVAKLKTNLGTFRVGGGLTCWPSATEELGWGDDGCGGVVCSMSGGLLKHGVCKFYVLSNTEYLTDDDLSREVHWISAGRSD
jgi:hypothetical protein